MAKPADIERMLREIVTALDRTREHLPAAWKTMEASTAGLSAQSFTGSRSGGHGDSPTERMAGKVDPARQALADVVDRAQSLHSGARALACAWQGRPLPNDRVEVPPTAESVVLSVSFTRDMLTLILERHGQPSHPHIVAEIAEHMVINSARLRDLVLDWSGQVRPAEAHHAPAENDRAWCTHHLRHGMTEPRARDGSNMCRWCCDFLRAQGHLPSKAVLVKRAAGGRITDADLARR
jgi:hypothetical protein